MLKRAKNRYEKQLEGDQNVKKRRTSDEIAAEVPTLTRSKTTPFDKNTCFFCGDPAPYQDPFHNVSTSSADRLRVKLSTAINPSDGHAIDIKHLKKCWLVHVDNTSRKRLSTPINCDERACIIAAEIEFLSKVDKDLNDGEILTMAELRNALMLMTIRVQKRH